MTGLKALALLGHLRHQLVIAGPTGGRARGEPALAERLGVAGRVRHIGWLSERELPAVYSLADALVFPLLLEDFGLPLLEAMACGCPVVTSTAGACPEVAGEAGLLASLADAGAITAAVERVVTDRALAAELHRRGLARARDLTWERTARATLDVLREAASNARGTARRGHL